MLSLLLWFNLSTWNNQPSKCVHSLIVVGYVYSWLMVYIGIIDRIINHLTLIDQYTLRIFHWLTLFNHWGTHTNRTVRGEHIVMSLPAQSVPMLISRTSQYIILSIVFTIIREVISGLINLVSIFSVINIRLVLSIIWITRIGAVPQGLERLGNRPVISCHAGLVVLIIIAHWYLIERAPLVATILPRLTGLLR